MFIDPETVPGISTPRIGLLRGALLNTGNPSLWAGAAREMCEYAPIREIVEHREFQRLGSYRHHGRSRLLHCLDVAVAAFLMTNRQGMDFVSAARGALLHDFFFYRQHVDGPRLHSFRHPAIALRTAREFFKLNEVEVDAIVKHMWPLTPVPPKYPESAFVCIADKIVAVREYGRALRPSSRIGDAFHGRPRHRRTSTFS
jgi:uncharacterized protein